MVFEPTERQAELWRLLAETPENGLTIVGYGGAAGGGKTKAIAELCVDTALDFPGTRLLMARKDLSDLRTTTMEEFYAAVPPEVLVSRYNSAPYWCGIRESFWPEGVVSRVFFRDLKEWTGLGSEEYGAAFIDEAGEVGRQAVLWVLTRLRHKKQSKRFLVAASNPWPGWFEDWFIKGNIDKEALKLAGGRIHFVPAKMPDNPHLPENYEELLRATLPADWVERFVEGRFDAFIGQVYPEFDLETHKWKGAMPRFKLLVGGLDFGGSNPWDHMTAGIAAGITDDGQQIGAGRLVRFSEFEDNGPGVYERLVEWMVEQEIRMGGQIQWVADKTQMFGIDRMKRQGFHIIQSHGGPGSVAAGIGMVSDRLRVEVGTPGSYYTPNMVKFPQRMRAYRWAEPKTDDEQVKPEPIKREDDLMDADRYMAEAVDGFPHADANIVNFSGRRRTRKAV